MVELLSLLETCMIVGFSSIVKCWAALGILALTLHVVLMLILVVIVVIVAMVWHGNVSGCIV